MTNRQLKGWWLLVTLPVIVAFLAVSRLCAETPEYGGVMGVLIAVRLLLGLDCLGVI